MQSHAGWISPRASRHVTCRAAALQQWEPKAVLSLLPSPGTTRAPLGSVHLTHVSREQPAIREARKMLAVSPRCSPASPGGFLQGSTVGPPGLEPTALLIQSLRLCSHLQQAGQKRAWPGNPSPPQGSSALPCLLPLPAPTPGRSLAPSPLLTTAAPPKSCEIPSLLGAPPSDPVPTPTPACPQLRRTRGCSMKAGHYQMLMLCRFVGFTCLQPTPSRYFRQISAVLLHVLLATKACSRPPWRRAGGTPPAPALRQG